MAWPLTILCLIVVSKAVECASSFNYTFPHDFMFGAATASYQVEGAWNVDGKGSHTWDDFTHMYPDRILDHSNGDDAAKSYYKYNEDIKAVKDMGMQFYRFSISWARIMPTGLPNYINQKGIDYYNNLINELLSNGLFPLVTMFHWDLPSELQRFGGWTSDAIVPYFEEYADCLFKNFGDRVKWWLTINEPYTLANGYEYAIMAPATNLSGIGVYMSSHNMIKAHGRAYRLYDKKYRSVQKGKVSLTIPIMWSEALNLNSSADRKAAELALQHTAGLYCHPIFSKEGDYPQVLKDNVGDKSLAQGFLKSRLPQFTPEEIEYIRGSADFLGLNEYSTFLVSAKEPSLELSFFNDFDAEISIPVQWIESNTSAWLTVAPKSIRRILDWFKKQYGPDWEILVTENGFADDGHLDDNTRITYLGTYLTEMLQAMYMDHSKVIGHTVWSLIDNFEWSSGYTSKFGLYHVDFNDPERKRTPKKSSFFMANITKTKQIPKKYGKIARRIDDVEATPRSRVKLLNFTDLGMGNRHANA
ncbi:myrosinase 1-like [Periplaneta americana]|uniref:myrosinase 1-like n=1 Tax=Periplaneta americana TaxID=6978 RepID=UPI0037E927C3